MPVRTCERCGEPFYVQYPCRPNRFCGYSCSNTSTAMRRWAHKAAKTDAHSGPQ
jgi:hypothetical protein